MHKKNGRTDGTTIQTTYGYYNLRFPQKHTLRALVLALMLKGQEVSTPALTYSRQNATRLPAYIQGLEDSGFEGLITVRNLPYRHEHGPRRNKPFAQYRLVPGLIQHLGHEGQIWADDVFDVWNTKPRDFKLGDAR